MQRRSPTQTQAWRMQDLQLQPHRQRVGRVLGVRDGSERTMIRRVILGALTVWAVVMACVGAWSSYWEGAIGGWEYRIGSVTIGHQGYGYDLVASVGSRTPGWRPWRFGQVDGFGYRRGPGYAEVFAPFWFAVLLLISYPAVALTHGYFNHRRAQERWAAEKCTRCGYDLTGLPEARCPECSEPVHVEGASSRRINLLRIADRCLLLVVLAVVSLLIIWVIGLSIELIASPWFGLKDWAAALLAGFPSVIAGGAATGLVWSTFGAPLLVRKPIRSIVRPLALAAFLGSVLSMILGGILSADGSYAALMVLLSAAVWIRS